VQTTAVVVTVVPVLFSLQVLMIDRKVHNRKMAKQLKLTEVVMFFNFIWEVPVSKPLFGHKFFCSFDQEF